MNNTDELTRMREMLQDAINDLHVAMAQEDVGLASHYVELAISGLSNIDQSSQPFGEFDEFED